MLVVVGGHSRNIGKTSVVSGLIRRFRDRRWTAVKITQYGHGICANKGTACECDTGDPEHPFALSEEYEPGKTDSGRFLAAGADRSFWLRAPSGDLPRYATTIQKLLKQSENVIVESNSILELVKPDLYLMVMDFACEDFKASSLQYIDRADAFIVIDRGGVNGHMFADLARGLWDDKPQFLVKPPRYVTPELAEFVASAPALSA